jgi:hypothetical protein
MRVHNFAFCNLAKIAMPDPVGTLGTVHRAPRARRARTRSLPQVLGSLRAPGAAAARPCPDPTAASAGQVGVVLGVGYQLNGQGASCAPGRRSQWTTNQQLRARGAAAAPRCWSGGLSGWACRGYMGGTRTSRAPAAPEPALKRGAPAHCN